jgi:transposase
VYNWVNRRERADSERKPASGPRPPSSPGVGPETGPEPDPADGSPPDHLDGRQLIELYDTLQNPPDAVGIEATRWTPDLLREYLLDAYGVAYSPAECARLLERAGYEPDT